MHDILPYFIIFQRGYVGGSNLRWNCLLSFDTLDKVAGRVVLMCSYFYAKIFRPWKSKNKSELNDQPSDLMRCGLNKGGGCATVLSLV